MNSPFSITRFDSSHLLRVTGRFTQPLAIIGGLWTAYQLTNFTSWTWTHFLRRGSLTKYQDKDRDSWALVTGASDGIGKGFAEELASRGFDVILHGRNEAKLTDIKNTLQSQFPNRKFRLIILDADSFTIEQMESALDDVKHLNIRILINNVAGGGKYEKPTFSCLQDQRAEAVDGWINISARFPTHITRLLLPTLIAKPSALIINVGSLAAEMSIGYLSVYSGAKSYNKAWSKCLQQELRAEGNGHVEVNAIIVGQVATGRSNKAISALIPSPRQMAKSSLEATGSGKKAILAYWGHAVEHAWFQLFPESFFDTYGLGIIRKMKEDEAKQLNKNE